jgi:tetratricopeptide (TPR) repeat protein
LSPLIAAPSSAEIIRSERELRKILSQLPPHAADGLLRTRLQAAPANVAALRLLAECEIRARKTPEALALLERALAAAPDHLATRRDMAALFLAQGRPLVALPHLEHLAAHGPKDVANICCLAWAVADAGDYDRALSLYESVIDDIDDPKFLLNYAQTLKYAGHRADSVHVYRSCAELVPSLGAAWWNLANLKNERFSAADIQTMNVQLENADIRTEDRIFLHYALGMALEQEGDFGKSFGHYSVGAALKRSTIAYNGTELTALMARSKDFFTAERFAERRGSGSSDPAPIFIVGLPRAGSTLIEQILASHSQVEGTRELPEISDIVRDIGTSNGAASTFIYPECLATMSPEALSALGDRYIERTRVYRRTDKPFFIDKMPANWAHIGLIQMILPNAKIIDARRAAMATCFSAFKQLFGHGVHYSYDQAELGRYYGAYVDRMAHYDAALPGRVYRVTYEKLVEDQDSAIRLLLDHCGLSFEPACLRFWESTRAVATPSSEQVRQPIFRDALDQWRNYESWLTPLKDALADSGVTTL